MNKAGLHPRNKHKTGYDFQALVKSFPALSPYIIRSKSGGESIDFSNGEAVKALNAALLKLHYGIDFWEIPKGYLCPPIPGRADYIHHAADLLVGPAGEIKKGPETRILDIGVGANGVYPLTAHREYGWSVVGSDIDKTALENVTKIIKRNSLDAFISVREQKNKDKIFESIIREDDYFHLTICNPPFHSSAREAREGTEKKNRKLGLKKSVLNFGGQNNELWCEGGEVSFIRRMIEESMNYQKNVLWFTTLVSKSTTLPEAYAVLKKHSIKKVRTIDMAQGQKKSRILAWTFSF